jgi:hypothetical protein
MGTLYKERSLVINGKPLFTWQLEAKQMWKKEIKVLKCENWSQDSRGYLLNIWHLEQIS